MHVTHHAIVFVTPFDADTSAVNLATGRHGFGHVALWGGHVEHGQPIVLDSALGIGVSLRPLQECTHLAPHRALYLDDALGAWLFARALRCLGKPYDYGGLFRERARDDAFTCSGLVACALPVQLEVRCRPRRGPVSPNDLARGLGVPRWSPAP